MLIDGLLSAPSQILKIPKEVLHNEMRNADFGRGHGHGLVSVFYFGRGHKEMHNTGLRSGTRVSVQSAAGP